MLKIEDLIPVHQLTDKLAQAEIWMLQPIFSEKAHDQVDIFVRPQALSSESAVIRLSDKLLEHANQIAVLNVKRVLFAGGDDKDLAYRLFLITHKSRPKDIEHSLVRDSIRAGHDLSNLSKYAPVGESRRLPRSEDLPKITFAS